MTDPFTVPELTRGLRSFAAPKALGGLHDRYFAPLLDARRAAKRATRWASRVSAFDAERLEATMRATVRNFAVERFPKSAPDKRALAAQIEDACEHLFATLAALGAEQSAVQAAADDQQREVAWRAWTTALQGVFSAADRGWEQVSKLAGTAPAVKRTALRRSRRAGGER